MAFALKNSCRGRPMQVCFCDMAHWPVRDPAHFKWYATLKYSSNAIWISIFNNLNEYSNVLISKYTILKELSMKYSTFFLFCYNLIDFVLTSFDCTITQGIKVWPIWLQVLQILPVLPHEHNTGITFFIAWPMGKILYI